MRIDRTFINALLCAMASAMPALAEGEPCNSSFDCTGSDWCRFPTGMCQSDEPLGTCRHSSGGCTLEFDPVCGCNGETITNAACAYMERVSILHEGQCGPPPCGGYQHLPCGAGEYCNVTAGECGPYYGVCEPAPASCPDLCESVCGCDGFDYANECAANVAGTGGKHPGACDSPTDGLVGGVGFDASGKLSWSAEDGAQSYNAYRRIVATVPPLADWSCWRSEIPGTSTPVFLDPLPGDTWWFEVTARFASGEGSMGMASDCSLRKAPVSCP